MEGFNGRCDAIQAAALRVKLKYLPEWNDARRKNANFYRGLLRGSDSVKLPEEAPGCNHVYHLFVVQVEKRDMIAETLHKRGINTGLHYPIPLHLQRAYNHIKRPAGSFPVAETAAEKILSLPMFPDLSEKQITYVCNELRNVAEGIAR